jgi:hypothetical protein
MADKHPARLADDAQIVVCIVAALEAVGRELDAADHLPGYEPWAAITRQETEVRRLAAGLSDAFRWVHPQLADRLLGCAALHMSWATLREEIAGHDPCE